MSTTDTARGQHTWTCTCTTPAFDPPDADQAVITPTYFVDGAGTRVQRRDWLARPSREGAAPPMKTITLHGDHSLTLTQHHRGHKALGGGPGGVVWPCGESFAWWFSWQKHGSASSSGDSSGGDSSGGDSQCVPIDPEVSAALSSGLVSSVLELGCGTGVVGLTLATLGVQRVVATDGDGPSCALCAANAERANLHTVATCELRWGHTDLSHVAQRIGRGGRCAQWIVGGDVVYHPHSARELEVTLRELLLLGGCSLVVLGWCERGQQAAEFLSKLSDLGTVRTVFRETNEKYSYLTKRNGRLARSEIEFGISILSVHPHITEGGGSSLLGAMIRTRQRLACACARLISASSSCLLHPSPPDQSEGGARRSGADAAPPSQTRLAADRATTERANAQTASLHHARYSSAAPDGQRDGSQALRREGTGAAAAHTHLHTHTHTRTHTLSSSRPSSMSDAHRAALLSHALPRRSHLPNRLEPFDCNQSPLIASSPGRRCSSP